MVGYGKIEHNNHLDFYLKKLEEQGFRTIKTQGVSPDAIAVKDNNIFDVECLGLDKIPSCGIYNIPVVVEKIGRYNMFDKVLFKVFVRKKHKKLTEEEADRLVDEFIEEMQENGL